MLFYEVCGFTLCLFGAVLRKCAGEDERGCDRSGGAAFFDTAHRAGCSAASVINKAPKACAFRALSYRNTIDFRTPDLKITMCETTLQSLLRFLCIISRFKLQNPVILRQHLHLANSNGVELCQPFRLRYSFIDEHGIQVFQV